jgi:hypothetical protein
MLLGAQHKLWQQAPEGLTREEEARVTTYMIFLASTFENKNNRRMLIQKIRSYDDQVGEI